MPVKKNQFQYDAKYDVMYISFRDSGNSYGDDALPGIILRRDIDTDEITGYTITRFKEMYIKQQLPMLPRSFPLSYDDLYQKIMS